MSATALASCGFCGLSAPDRFGNRDLLEHPDCPLHGRGAEAYRCKDRWLCHDHHLAHHRRAAA